jgi:hypothetical protein
MWVTDARARAIGKWMERWRKYFSGGGVKTNDRPEQNRNDGLLDRTTVSVGCYTFLGISNLRDSYDA